MSKRIDFSNFLTKLEEYENVFAWCTKLIENGRQALQSVSNYIDNEHLTKLMDSFMSFILLLAQCNPNLSDEKNSLISTQSVQLLKQQIESKDLLSKNDIIKMVNNDLQCPICNEWLYRATSANCNHTFCETCIRKWLKINKTCPVCRSSIQYTSTSIAVDNFISNLCQLFGGFIKEKRDSIQNARIGQNENQTNVEFTVNELRNDLSTNQSFEHDTYVSELEVTMPMTHPNMVRLMPSSQLSQTPVSRTNIRQPIVSSSIPHPNTVQLSPYPYRSSQVSAENNVSVTSSHSNRLPLISSTSGGSPRVNRFPPTSLSSVVNPR